MTVNEKIIDNLCISVNLKTKLLKKLSCQLNTDVLIKTIQKHEKQFNCCSDCYSPLTSINYGYLTIHGLCDECSFEMDYEYELNLKK